MSVCCMPNEGNDNLAVNKKMVEIFYNTHRCRIAVGADGVGATTVYAEVLSE